MTTGAARRIGGPRIMRRTSWSIGCLVTGWVLGGFIAAYHVSPILGAAILGAVAGAIAALSVMSVRR